MLLGNEGGVRVTVGATSVDVVRVGEAADRGDPHDVTIIETPARSTPAPRSKCWRCCLAPRPWRSQSAPLRFRPGGLVRLASTSSTSFAITFRRLRLRNPIPASCPIRPPMMGADFGPVTLHIQRIEFSITGGLNAASRTMSRSIEFSITTISRCSPRRNPSTNAWSRNVRSGSK